MKRISVYLTEQQIAQLQILAQRLGLSFSEVLRRLLDEQLRKEQS